MFTKVSTKYLLLCFKFSFLLLFRNLLLLMVKGNHGGVSFNQVLLNRKWLQQGDIWVTRMSAETVKVR